MHSRSIIARLRADGWYPIRVKGSHHHFKHPTRPGLVTVPHPVRDVPPGTIRSIERQSATRLREGGEGTLHIAKGTRDDPKS